MSISLKPKRAKTIQGHDSWWYDDRQSIHVLIQPTKGVNAVSCKIKRSELVKYIQRSTP